MQVPGRRQTEARGLEPWPRSLGIDRRGRATEAEGRQPGEPGARAAPKPSLARRDSRAGSRTATKARRRCPRAGQRAREEAVPPTPHGPASHRCRHGHVPNTQGGLPESPQGPGDTRTTNSVQRPGERRAAPVLGRQAQGPQPPGSPERVEETGEGGGTPVTTRAPHAGPGQAGRASRPGMGEERRVKGEEEAHKWSWVGSRRGMERWHSLCILHAFFHTISSTS